VRAIVTGGAGFVGSHVAEALLDRGDRVVVVDDLSTGRRTNVPRGARFVRLDIRDAGLGDVFAQAEPEVCFHLAAQSSVSVSVQRPELDADVNVGGTIRVLEAARSVGAQVVFSSTGGAIYGDCDGPMPESAPRRPLAPYGASKLAGEEYLELYNRLYGSSHVALRYANVYGPRQDPHGEAGVVAIFFGRLREGKPCRIFGDGLQTRDYVFVGDVARATLAAAGHAGGVFNVGTGIETTVVSLYELCRHVAGSGAEPEFAPPRLGEARRSVVDPSRAARELGWRPETSLEDGLRATWAALETWRGETRQARALKSPRRKPPGLFSV
jgi:UDP-glucose 4-epimerase